MPRIETLTLETAPAASQPQLNAGHFALETNGSGMAALIRDFLGRKLRTQKVEN